MKQPPPLSPSKGGGNKRNHIIIFLAFFLSFLFLGCFGVSRDFKSLRNELIENNQYEFEKDFEISLGPVSLWMLEQIAGLADEKDFPQELFDQISRIQVGIYKREQKEYSAFRDNSSRSNFDNNFLHHINKELNSKGMKYIVKNIDGDELNLVYVNNDLSEGFDKLFVVNLNSEQLVLVELKGDIDKLMMTALRKKKLDF